MRGATDIVLTSDGNWAYVVSSNTVSIIYTPLRIVTATIQVYQGYGIATAPDGFVWPVEITHAASVSYQRHRRQHKSILLDDEFLGM